MPSPPYPTSICAKPSPVSVDDNSRPAGMHHRTDGHTVLNRILIQPKFASAVIGRSTSPGRSSFFREHGASFGRRCRQVRRAASSLQKVSKFWVDVRVRSGRKKVQMGPLVDRTEFRAVLQEVVKCVRQNLDVPGLKPLAPEQLMSWFRNITLEDLQAVARAIDNEG